MLVVAFVAFFTTGSELSISVPQLSILKPADKLWFFVLPEWIGQKICVFFA
jgi:hypothetical protein